MCKSSQNISSKGSCVLKAGVNLSGRPSVKSAKGKTSVSGKLFFMSMFTTKLMKATGENFIAGKKWLIKASRIQMTCKHSYRVCRCQWSLPGVRLEKEQRNGIRTKNREWADTPSHPNLLLSLAFHHVTLN